MKLIKKINRVLIILIALFLISTTSVNATSIWQTGKDWLALGERERASSVVGETAFNEFEDLAGLLFGLGIFVALVVGVIIGIKFMISSPDEKANLKKTLIPYLVGTIIILGALGIWKLSVNLLEEIAH